MVVFMGSGPVGPGNLSGEAGRVPDEHLHTVIQEEEVNSFPFGEPNSGAFNTGMDMRQYYAAKAMQTLIAIHPDQLMDFIAKRAFGHADAMIAAELSFGDVASSLEGTIT